MVIETWLKTDRKKPIAVKALQGNLFSADNGANLIGVEVVEDGSPATLSGGVIGYVVRADGATVVVNGTLSGNRATVTLPASCYAVVGSISIVIKVGTTTVGACTGYVYRSSTDEIIDPGHVVPSLQELLAQIQNCIDATASANTAAGTANTAASNADAKATLANNAATNANDKAGAANTAAQTANTAAGKIENMTVSATGLEPTASPTVTITEVDGHKHIAFGLVKGDPGDATIDDTAGEGDVDRVWSADKSARAIGDLKSAFALFQENIPGTVQTIAFDSAGNIQSVTHRENNVVVRTDVFTFAASTITEVRTLASGESLTIVTNTETLETTTTYAAA